MAVIFGQHSHSRKNVVIDLGRRLALNDDPCVWYSATAVLLWSLSAGFAVAIDFLSFTPDRSMSISCSKCLSSITGMAAVPFCVFKGAHIDILHAARSIDADWPGPRRAAVAWKDPKTTGNVEAVAHNPTAYSYPHYTYKKYISSFL